ncbi:MAG TPA: caspase family protein, partial [Candidatus Tectomicrobia bacterium]
GGEGQPGSLTLTGRLAADGTGSIDARGLIGDPKYAINRIAKGTPYAYRATAHFDDTRGTATRVQVRPCTLTFVKQ